MGSYISIGLIFEEVNEQKIEVNLKKLIQYLLLDNGVILGIKFSKDADGEKWMEVSNVSETNLMNYYYKMSRGFFGEAVIKSNILGIINLKTTIRLKKETDYFGFLIDFEEDLLIKKKTNEQIKNITDKIIIFLKELYNNILYDYAFCEHEGDIIYSPKEFKNLDEIVYSIAIVPVANGFRINKSNWNIDGLTIRN